MTNPFRVRWLEGWTFQTVLQGGQPTIEAYGFGVCLRAVIVQGESPTEAADRLVLEEDRLRRSLRNAWKRGPLHLLHTVLDVERGEELTLGSADGAAKKGSNARSASKELRKTVACDVYVIASHAGERTCLDLQHGTSTRRTL